MCSFSLYSHLPSLSTSTVDPTVKTPIFIRESFHENPNRLSLFRNASRTPITVCCSAQDSSDSVPTGDNLPSGFCIIKGPETVQDFVQMQLQEIQDNIKSRRNKIFLLMEEVRRLRGQQRIKSFKVVDGNSDDENEMPDIPSTIPFLPHVTPKTLKQLYLTSFSFISGIIVFGGLLAPTVRSRC
ncbi:protein ORANGE-LIKE, chloroplastic-like isoform X3 [Actinidia eriantha]|uniref:protein ORANGE-LIKE, chloroplastic-like isoform X3 n=1 Tax=Actinidia eriantha TaxID=165200 RepID=UPI00258F2D57|nr:protein ORANGE-LIKE, chloroplastic-like isoform X3 [Actinidia eriantha]